MGQLRQLFQERGFKRAAEELLKAKEIYTGNFKGTDALGNRYYEDLNRVPYRQRFVVYADIWNANGSAVTAEWHSWLHHKTDKTPSEENYPPIKYALPHLPNQLSQMGVGGNYLPPGHLARVIMDHAPLSSQPLQQDSSSSSSSSSSFSASWNRTPPPTSSASSVEDSQVVRDSHTWSAKMEKEKLNSGSSGSGGIGTRIGGRYKPWNPKTIEKVENDEESAKHA